MDFFLRSITSEQKEGRLAESIKNIWLEAYSALFILYGLCRMLERITNFTMCSLMSLLLQQSNYNQIQQNL